MEYIKVFFEWYMGNINYVSVTFLMMLESTIIPIPSEVIVPPAAWLAAGGTINGQSVHLNVVLVAICGTVGSVLGALINYFVSDYLGRPVLYAFADSKLGRMLMLSSHKLESAEKFYLKYGRSSTFVGRLVPVIRHLISIPAGLSRMKLSDFILYTAAGALVWNIILCAIGFYIWEQKELLARYEHLLKLGMLGIFAVFVLWIVLKNFVFRKKVA